MKRIFLALWFLASMAQAQSWDAAADFSAGENPRLVWSYGWSTGHDDFTLMVDRGRDKCGIPFPGFDCFGANRSYYPLPQIVKNDSGVGVVWDQTGNGQDYPSITTFGLGALFMRPDTYLGPKWPVLRFTTPAAGVYKIIGSAQLVDVATQGAVLHIPGGDRALLAFGDAKHFQILGTFAAGDYIDFMLEPVGNAYFATTAIRVSAMRLE